MNRLFLFSNLYRLMIIGTVIACVVMLNGCAVFRPVAGPEETKVAISNCMVSSAKEMGLPDIPLPDDPMYAHWNIGVNTCMMPFQGEQLRRQTNINTQAAADRAVLGAFVEALATTPFPSTTTYNINGRRFVCSSSTYNVTCN